MPIKLPKGFQRRKSSGNALEEVLNPPEGASSFRVLERPGSKEKSFDGGVTMRLTSPDAPHPPPKDHRGHAEDDVFAVGRPDANNRGSGGTERSHSSAPYDSAASSTRRSTSSTNPSSIDTRSDKNVPPNSSRPFNDIPAPPPASARPGFLRSPARTFSFGMVKGNRGSPTSPHDSLPSLIDNRKQRSVTASTASTATPPRLFDSDLALENAELDGFGNMFDHIGPSSDPAPIRLIQQEPAPGSSPPMTDYPPTSFPSSATGRASRAPIPKPILTDRTQVIDSSPYSWASHNSRDGLMRSPSPSRTITQTSPGKASEPAKLNPQARVPARRPVGPSAARGEEAVQSPPSLKASPVDTNLLSSSPVPGTMVSTSPGSTHSATFDLDIAADAQLASMFEQSKPAPPKPVQTTKVMTPAQWERYKQQKEMDRRLGALSDDSGSEGGDDYEDDDELERDRKAAKQRQKQEAHLSVYRQTMMKVTGEPASGRPESSLNTWRHGNGSSTDLDNRLSHLTIDSRQSGKSSGEDEEEDEDVPLGILAAHGFPNKNRPPTRLTTSVSNPNLRSISQAAPAPSVVAQTPKPGNLPVFARHLPQDPYFGAGLVNPSNRESLAAYNGAPPQGYGSATAHPVHPAGLVGVIAGEERARAARRGSPNASGNYEMPGLPPHPGMVRSQTAGAFPAMGYPPMGMPGMHPAMMGAGDAAQMQISQQMSQMMQMQMQWMQQMQQMMGGQFNPNMGMPPSPGPQMGPELRPQSVHAMNGFPGSLAGQRTMSMVNPNMASWQANQAGVPSINVNGNYAHSIAPSERSNIGLAPRYRPVSVAPEPDNMTHRRASTFTSNSIRPWSEVEGGARGPTHASKPSTNTLGRRSPLAHQDDEDDEQGWAEMMKKKATKQKSWALRKGQNPLQELYTNAT